MTDAVRYRLRQSFTYSYDGPAHSLVHRLVVVPPAVHGDQRLIAGTVEVSDPSADVRWHDDELGNRHCVVRLAQVPRELELQVAVSVERGGPAAARAWPAALAVPTELTAPDDAVTALARSTFVLGDVLASADAFCGLVRETIRYEYGVTDVDTTAAQALALGVGVCQDQAHLMLAMCRSAGIPARYVSGHLVGQGGTHAWTEVLVPDKGVIAFDPCHGRRTDARYVTVAVGRDYRDVPPTSGTYEGPGRGQLRSSRVLERESAAA